MFKNINNFLNIFKDNKKLFYTVNIFILLVIISFILKIDTSKNNSNNKLEPLLNNPSKIDPVDSYTNTLEKKMEEMIKEIEGVKKVNVMLYTKNTPMLEPVYDENTSSETNIEIGSDGIKREIKRDTKQNQVKMGSNNQVIEKYYQYPKISGVLIVVHYTGSKNINNILINSVKTLFNINLNNIEIVLAN